MLTTNVRKLAAVFVLAAPLAGGCATAGRSDGGCDSGSCADGGGVRGDRASFQDRYTSCIDPCWPDRYSYQARQLTLAPFAAHVANGQALDQTILNGDFETGTERLSAGGLAKLDTISRRRPVDGRVFLQTARDVAYDPAKAADYVKTKADLDTKRTAAVRDYLSASTSGRNLNFELAVTDPGDTTLSAVGPANSTRGYNSRFTSAVTGLITANSGGVGGVNPTANVTGQAGGAAAPANTGGGGGNTGTPGTGTPGTNPQGGTGGR